MAEPWVKFYASDWLAGTRGLSAAETGVYITLVAMMYERETPLARENARLARMCGCPTTTFRRILINLIDERKIVVLGDGRLWNRKVDEETAQRRCRVEKARGAANDRWHSDAKNQGSERREKSHGSGSLKNTGHVSEKPNDNNGSDHATASPEHTPEHQSSRVHARASEPEPERSKEEEYARANGSVVHLGINDPEPADLFRRVLRASRVDTLPRLPRYWMPPAAEIHVQRWRDDLGLTEDRIVAVVEAEQKGRDPPQGPKAYDDAMQRLAASLNAPALQPKEPRHDRPTAADRRAERAEHETDADRAFLRAMARPAAGGRGDA